MNLPPDATRSGAFTADGVSPPSAAAVRQPSGKFHAKCNACGGRLGPDSFITSCRHFVCERCLKRPDACAACRQPCRVVQLKAPDFPAEIKERSSLQVEQAGTKGVAACRLQNTHLAEVAERQAQILTRAHAAVQRERQEYATLEQTYRSMKHENGTLRATAAAAEAEAAGGGQRFASPSPFPEQDPFASVRGPSVASLASSRGSMLGKTLMRE